MAELLAYVLLSWVLLRSGMSAAFTLFAIIVVAIIWRASHVLVSFTVATLMRRQAQRDERSGTTIPALWSEFCARLISFNWSQPFSDGVMGREPAGSLSGTPILLIPGYLSNRGMWVQFRARLIRDGLGPVYAIDLEPPFGDIDHFVAQLAARIEQIGRETGAEEIHIVAHSMGGLVIRSYLASNAVDRLRPRILTLTMLGSPHHGTKLATFGIGRAVKQMRQNSAWLRKLAALECQREQPPPPTLSLFTRNDDLIYPPESAELPWANNVAVDSIGHVGLLFSEPVYQLVKSQLARKDK